MVDCMEFTKVMLILYQKNRYLEEIINCYLEEITNCYLEEIRKYWCARKNNCTLGHDLSYITAKLIMLLSPLNALTLVIFLLIGKSTLTSSKLVMHFIWL